MPLSKAYRFGLLVCLLVMAATPAFAFILPADAILSSMARRRAQMPFKTLVLHGRYKAGTEPEKELYEVLNRKARRREIKGEQDSVVELVKGGSRWLYRSGEPQPKPERITLPHPLDVFIVSGTETEAEKLLRDYGIDPREVNLGRFEKRVAYIIGAKPWEPEKPQLWVDKELMVPLRLVGKDAQGRMLEYRTLGFDSAQTNEWYPQRVEHWEDGKLTETITYRRVELDPKVDPNLLDAPKR